MGEREMLELAAKAAGHQVLQLREYEDGSGWWAVVRGSDEDSAQDFDPLGDDGDAFRLAVKMGLTINPYKRGVFVSRDEDEPVIREEWGEDDAQTTRRAITRAAAELARAQGEKQ